MINETSMTKQTTGVNESAARAAMSDADLLQAWQTGDRSAMDELYRRYLDVSWRIARAHVGNDADADDAVQESWVLVCRHAASFRHGTQARAWILRIVVNSCVSHLRRDQRRHRRQFQSLLRSGRATHTAADRATTAAMPSAPAEPSTPAEQNPEAPSCRPRDASCHTECRRRLASARATAGTAALPRRPQPRRRRPCAGTASKNRA